MKPIETLIRNLLTIDRLQRSSKPIPTQELLNYVNDELEKRAFRIVTLRTLQRDFIDIELQFGYKVKNNGYGYSIERAPGYMAHRFDEMLLDFDLLTAINSDSHLQQYILAEHHRPVGSKQMYPLMRAIRESRMIEFNYVLYRKDCAVIHKQVAPHFLKESNQRWYLLAKEDDTLKSFGIDRINDLQVLPNQFVRDESIDVEKLFRDSYGIWNDPKMPIEDIELRYDTLDGSFLKSVPLHHSQHILVDNDEEFRISLRLRITNDFVMELLSRSRSLTVIRPQSLRERIIKVYEEALKRNSE
ncbi:MAG: WYL domain-containing protein [Prevotella sp.]|nr:WYL domain-containing protein [Prevotella sp.]